MLPVCMSSRTSPCPATLLAKTASIAGALTLVPMIDQGPAPAVASPCACRAQGSACASKAQARKSRRQILSFSPAAEEISPSLLATIADAMRTESGALRVVGPSARTTELDIETSRVLVSLNCRWSAGLHTQARCDFRLGGRAIRRLIVAAKDRLNLIADETGDKTSCNAHWPLSRSRKQKFTHQGWVCQRPAPNAPGVQEMLHRALRQYGVSDAPLDEAQRRRHRVDLEHDIGDDTKLLELVVDEDAQAMRARGQNDRDVGEPLGGHAVAPKASRIIDGAEENEFIREQRLGLERRQPRRLIDDPNVHPAGGEPLGDVTAEAFREMKKDPREGLTAAHYERTCQHPANRRRHRDGDTASRLGLQGPYFRLGLFHETNNAARIGLEHLARLGHDHSAPVAVEEFHPKLRLQQFDLPAQDRLGHRQTDGRLGETPRFRDSQKVVELLQFH